MNDAGDGRVLIALDGVRKSWGDQLVLDCIDLEIPAGAVIGVAGGNGAGKTTLLRIATGIILPDEGTIHSLGADIERDRASFQRAIGFLSAGDRGLYARLTVRQNLDFWAGLSGFRRRQRQRRIEAMIAEFEIGEFADRRVDRLSMGQRQRVRLAVTFLHEPRVVFLDEPRTSLDDAGIALFENAVARLVENGGAALLVSPAAGEQKTDRSWVLRDAALHEVQSHPSRAEAPGAAENDVQAAVARA